VFRLLSADAAVDPHSARYLCAPLAARRGADLPVVSLDADRRAGPRRWAVAGIVRHRRADLVQRPLARPRLRHRRLSVEMDAVLDADFPRGALDDPARYL